MPADAPSLRPGLDLRTDALTQPTEEMWTAMRAARCGWAGEDPSIRELEGLAAELCGTARALFVPTGSVGNLVALLAQARPGQQVLMEERSHVLWSEAGGYAHVGGLLARPFAAADGRLEAGAVEEALEESCFGHRPRTALVCLENTHNASGGVATVPERVAEVCEVAHRRGAAVHVDGARLLNAAVALGVPARDLVAHADSTMVNLNKGLSAPAGAVLCGSAELVARARELLATLGAASLHQAGIWAAAGIVALQTMVARLGEDHETARLLARGLSGLEGLRVLPAEPRTNIVMVELASPCARALVARLLERGVGAYMRDDAAVRLVTHRHVTRDDAAEAARIVATAWQELDAP